MSPLVTSVIVFACILGCALLGWAIALVSLRTEDRSRSHAVAAYADLLADRSIVSFGLFDPRNATVMVSLLISALAVCGAIFLILEIYHPDTGLLKVSDAPLRAAFAQLGHK